MKSSHQLSRTCHTEIGNRGIRMLCFASTLTPDKLGHKPWLFTPKPVRKLDPQICKMAKANLQGAVVTLV